MNTFHAALWSTPFDESRYNIDAERERDSDRDIEGYIFLGMSHLLIKHQLLVRHSEDSLISLSVHCLYLFQSSLAEISLSLTKHISGSAQCPHGKVKQRQG